MAEIASFDGLLIVHAEDPDVILANTCPPTSRYADFVSSRPPLAETRAIETVIDAARSTGCRAQSCTYPAPTPYLPWRLPARRAYGSPWKPAPHYLALSAEDVADGATQFKAARRCVMPRTGIGSGRRWRTA